MLLMLQCAAAQAVTRLEDGDRQTRLLELVRGRDARSPRPDDDEGQEVGAARLKADGEEGIAPNPR